MKTGELFAGRFEIECLAARGGMGAIYRGIDQSSGATVAIKVLDGHIAQFAARFDLEGRVLAELRHPGIVRYVAHGRTQDGGASFIAMEWLEGEDLAQRLERAGLDLSE